MPHERKKASTTTTTTEQEEHMRATVYLQPSNQTHFDIKSLHTIFIVFGSIGNLIKTVFYAHSALVVCFICICIRDITPYTL